MDERELANVMIDWTPLSAAVSCLLERHPEIQAKKSRFADQAAAVGVEVIWNGLPSNTIYDADPSRWNERGFEFPVHPATLDRAPTEAQGMLAERWTALQTTLQGALGRFVEEIRRGGLRVRGGRIRGELGEPPVEIQSHDWPRLLRPAFCFGDSSMWELGRRSERVLAGVEVKATPPTGSIQSGMSVGAAIEAINAKIAANPELYVGADAIRMLRRMIADGDLSVRLAKATNLPPEPLHPDYAYGIVINGDASTVHLPSMPAYPAFVYTTSEPRTADQPATPPKRSSGRPSRRHVVREALKDLDAAGRLADHLTGPQVGALVRSQLQSAGMDLPATGLGDSTVRNEYKDYLQARKPAPASDNPGKNKNQT